VESSASTERPVTAPPPEAPEADLVARPPSRLRVVVGAVVSIAALGGCVWWGLQQDAPQFPHGAGSWALLVFAALLTAGTAAARGWRWDAILRFSVIGHQRGDAYGLTAVGYMANNVLPARGGELVRVFMLADRSGARRRMVLGTVLTERALDAGTLVILFAVLTAFNVADSPAGRAPAFIAAGVVVLAVVAMVVYLRLRIAGRFQSFADRMRVVLRPFRLLISWHGVLLALLTSGIWALEALIFWLVAQSLNLDVSPLGASLVVVLASFFALIPAAPGYVGTFDAAVLFALHALKVPSDSALGAAITYRFVIFVPITLAGLILLITHYGGLRQALRKT
jgi:uncharacterized protein (TIRG00374 family)